MPNPRNKPTTISALHLRRQLGQVIHSTVSDKQHFILEKNGIPVLAIVPLGDYQVVQEKLDDEAKTPK